MRNLKRVLSLAMALVMVLGMMVITTNAADFTDAEEITYKEAVGVMAEIGILKGMGDGTFAPKGTLTRAQAAKIIAFVMMGADADTYLTGSASAFEDVAADDWAAKYVAFCKNAKIIDGVNAEKTLFNPAGTLTTVQFGKMILNALEIEGTYTGAGWENNVKKALEEAELDVITIDSSEITREEACEMALAAMKYAPASAGWAVKSGNTVLKTFADEVDAIVYKATMASVGVTGLSIAPVAASGYLLDESYGVTYGDSFDTFGRPGIRYTKTNAINLFFADKPVATYVNSFNEDIYDAMVEVNPTVFTGTTVTYNGAPAPADEDSIDELFLSTTGNAINGRTIEFYNTDADKDIELAVVIEAGLATVGEFVAATAISDAYVTLSVVRMGPADNAVMTVTDDDEKTDDLYDALAAAYAEDDVVAITTKSGWDLNATTLADESYILAVEPTTAVSGKITKVATAGQNCTTVITINGTEYALNNMCEDGKSLTVGTEGTLYLDAQGKGLGWADKYTAPPAKPIVYLVDVYERQDTVVNEMTGVASVTSTYWALCVTTAGEVVTYQVKDTCKSIGTDADGLVSVNEMVEVTTSIELVNNKPVTFASFETKNVKTTGELKATDIKIDGNNYYTDGVKFIYVEGSMEELEVVVKEGAQAIASGANKWYEAKAIRGDNTNKTTSYVFVGAGLAPDSVTVSGVVYAAEGANSTTQVLWTDENGDEQPGFEHTVYVDGVKTTVVTATENALSGFLTLTEVVEGVYTVAPKSANNLKTDKAISNMYKGMITITGEANLVDVDVTGVTVINVSGNTKVPTDATKLATSETVDLVLTSDGKGIVTIYVTESTRS